MNQKNFLQKYFIEIMVILLLLIAIIIAIHKNRPGTNQNQPPLSSLDSRKKETLASEETEIEKPLSDSPKLSLEEPPIPKIKTTAARFEQIKNYLFTEPTNPTLLPTDLSEREQEEINKLKKSWQSSLDLLKEQKTWIAEDQKKCDEYQSQLNLIFPQITSWEQQKKPLEKQLEQKSQEVKTKREEKKQFQYVPNLTEELRTSKQKKYNLLEAEIKKLQEETSEIVVKIKNINIQIGKLEATQKKYQEMLANAEKYKKIFEERYEEVEKQYKDLILSQLNELYDITSVEG
ncbi:MAG: hypothetical protein Q8872_01230 [Candidatus Phytoplasma australasiaticum]|nr:hypothetical protein [Candidatus Phytoplasma australasiaticum]